MGVITNLSLGAGTINYVSADGGAESGTGTWVTYNDGASATPLDAVGGLASLVTLTTDNVTPLRGSQSLVLNKLAGNAQGQGISIPFTIDTADLAKPLHISFDYALTSATGTYSDGRLTVYVIQDPTGTPTVIQPAGYTVMSGSQGIQLKHLGCTFQTSPTIKNYRLCIHVASTDTTAYSLELDNVEVGPERAAYGVPVTDWVSYNPTWTSAGTAPSIGNGSLTGKYRRVGDSVEIQINMESGTSTAYGSANPWFFGLPLGFSIDSSKISTVSQSVGSAYAIVSATKNAYLGTVYTGSNALIVLPEGGGVSYAWQSDTPIAWAAATSNQRVNISATVPIQGWSSNTVLSQDTDTRVVAMYASTASGTITGAPSDVTWSTISKDTHSSFNGVTYTVSVSGFYQISSQVRIAATYVAGNAVGIALNVNSSNVMYGLARAGGAQVDVSPTLTTIRYLNAGDLVKIQVDSAGTSPSFSGGGAYNYLSIYRLSGPATIAASEFVGASFKDSTTTLSSGGATLVFPSAGKVYDSHGAMNTSTGIYTVPVSGKYSLSCFLLTTQTTGTGSITLNAFQTGSDARSVELQRLDIKIGLTSNSGRKLLQGDATFNCLAGDTLYVVGYDPDATSAIAGTRLSITRIG